MDQPASHHQQLVPDPSRKVRAFAGLAFCLAVPSCGVIQKYFGNVGLLIYLVAAIAILWLTYRYLAEPFLLRLSERESVYLLLLTFVALIAIFAIVYPKANVHIAGRGSDADDGLNLAVNELLNGRYPYSARTYLDNPISPLPGAILLAIPFVLFGSSAYQNLFWLGVFCFVLFRMMQSWRATLILFLTILIFSPVVVNDVVTGGDYPTNTIYVLVFMLLTLSWGPRADSLSWKKLLAVLLLGIGLSSRANFLLLMPSLFSALTLRAGSRTAATYSALALLACAATCRLHTIAHSSAQSFRVSRASAICEPGHSGLGRLHRDGSGVAEHQAPARDLAQRLCDCSGISGCLRGYTFRNSDENAFAHLDQLRSFLFVFWCARLWIGDVRDY